MSSQTAGPKRMKIARTNSANSDEPEALESSPGSDDRRLCVICGNTAANKIEKDSNYDAMLQLYWCTLGIDVKPEACHNSDLCVKCFDKKTLKGVLNWEKDGRALTRVHQEIKKKYADGPDISEQEEENIKEALAGYNMGVAIKEKDGVTVRKIKFGKDASSDDDGAKQDGAGKKKPLKISLKTTSSEDKKGSKETSESDESE